MTLAADLVAGELEGTSRLDDPVSGVAAHAGWGLGIMGRQLLAMDAAPVLLPFALVALAAGPGDGGAEHGRVWISVSEDQMASSMAVDT